MRACIVSKPGNEIELKEIPIPEISDDQLLIQIKAAGVNPVDTYIRAGKYTSLPPCPYTPGFDGAGIVSKVGPNCKKYKVGDRVYILKAISPHGTYAEYSVVSVNSVFPLSHKLTFEQGAAIGIPYYSAHRALFHCAKAKCGECVFVHGATGAVGVATCELAIANGLEVYGTAGTEAGEAALLKLGVKGVFNHHKEGYVAEIMKSNLKIGVIIECLANVNLENDLMMVANEGRIIVVGVRGTCEIDPRKILLKEVTVMGMYLLRAKPGEIAVSAEEINGLADSGGICPMVSHCYGLGEANEAHTEVIEHSGGSRGKIVIVP